MERRVVFSRLNSEPRNDVFPGYSGTFVPCAIPPQYHCVCTATGALCSAVDRHSPVSMGSRATWPEEPWGRTSRALIFCELPTPVRGRVPGMRSAPSNSKPFLVPNCRADAAARCLGGLLSHAERKRDNWRKHRFRPKLWLSRSMSLMGISRQPSC